MAKTNAVTVARGGVLTVEDERRGEDLSEKEIIAEANTEQLNAGGLRDIHPGAELAVDPTEALLGALDELGDDAGQARVVIYRKSSDPRNKPAWVNEWYASEFKISELAAGFGGGIYNYTVRGVDGRIISRGILPVEEPKNPTAIKNAPVAVDNSPAAIAGAIIAGLSPILQPLIDRPQKSTKEMLEELALMKTVVSGEPVSRQEPIDFMTQFNKMFEFHTLLDKLKGGGSKGGDGDNVFGSAIAELAKQFAPEIMGALKAGAAAKAAMQPVADKVLAPPALESATTAAPIPSNLPTAVSDQPQPTGEDMNLALKMALSQLNAKARANSDPALYAHFVADNIPDDFLIDVCTRTDWFEWLCGINDALKPFHAWYMSLREELVKIAIENELINADRTKKAVAP